MSEPDMDETWDEFDEDEEEAVCPGCDMDLSVCECGDD